MAVEKQKTRIERDSMGEMEVPEEALWGASTQRAVLNFPVSGERFPSRFIRALGIIKEAAAEPGNLDPEIAESIPSAARELADGALDAHSRPDSTRSTCDPGRASNDPNGGTEAATERRSSRNTAEHQVPRLLAAPSS